MLHFLPTSHFLLEQRACYLVREASPGDEDASRCLTLHAAAPQPPRSMAAIFSLASHEEARDVNVTPCLLNTQ